MIQIQTPLTLDVIHSLHAGDHVLLSGTIYTARDAAHLRMMECIQRGVELPIPLKGQIIYYAGPTPTRPGQIVGSIGPTTSVRMDNATPALLERGLSGMIGKGSRGENVKQAMQRYPSVYFAAIGGAAALMARCVTSLEVIAWDDLGPESIKKLVVQELPLIVAVDSEGNDAFQIGQSKYLETLMV